ncbi:hypothetical protein MJI69_31880, partial [Salmonella enterica subsp. enterica serovar Anatum]|nr:hypothetical protein [Salmonella enterica subsp. enterica serovar Anatum]
LSSLADLSRYLKEGGTFKLAASAEFIERADALPAFEKAYDFTSRSQVSDDKIRKARKLREALAELDQVWTTIGLTIGTALMP